MKLKKPTNVKEMFKWKSDKKNIEWIPDVEEFNINYTNNCGGIKQTDVLYSFFSIYAIGIWVFNKNKPSLFKCYCNKIMVSIDNGISYKQNLLSQKFLLELQNSNSTNIEVKEINECIKPFINVYFSVGNLIPIWPGGNIYKGNQNNGCMDIPELFFAKFPIWYNLLLKLDQSHLNTFNEYMIQNKSRFLSLSTFLDSVDNIEKYNEFIAHIVYIITTREKNINLNI